MMGDSMPKIREESYPHVEFDLAKPGDKSAIEDCYIITLTAESDKELHMKWIRNLSKDYKSWGMQCEVLFDYDIIKGYAAMLGSEALKAVARCPDVKRIAQDKEGAACAVEAGKSSFGSEQTDIAEAAGLGKKSPWGLQRISYRERLPPGSCPNILEYDFMENIGHGSNQVDVYVLDSGIRTDHPEFEGRASWGASFPSTTETDASGHGTHVAGTIAGRRYGVARNANVISVKICDDVKKQFSRMSVLAGFDWVKKQVQRTKRASIVNLSIVYEAPFPELAQSIEQLVNMEQNPVAVCVAAGNNAGDTRHRSPGCLSSVITVAASNIKDELWCNSNYGDAVDIIAPGEDVLSADYQDDYVGKRMSGTSMAAPHVTGVAATILRCEKLNPTQLLTRLQSLAVPDVIQSLDSKVTIW